MAVSRIVWLSMWWGAGPQIASPDGGSDWRLRIQANFLFPR
jgi:hypothetical protein